MRGVRQYISWARTLIPKCAIKMNFRNIVVRCAKGQTEIGDYLDFRNLH